MATFFFPQSGRCREVQLYSSKLQCDEKRYPTFEQPGPEVPYSLKAVARVASVSA